MTPSLIFLLAPTSRHRPATDSVKLNRTYKVGETSDYKIFVDYGSSIKNISMNLRVKTTEIEPSGRATLELSITKLIRGSTEFPPPEIEKWSFGSDGMAVADVKHGAGAAFFTIYSILSFVPGTVRAKREFRIDWKSPNNSSTIKGKGTYVGTKRQSGISVVLLKTDVNIRPEGSEEGKLHSEGVFELSTGRLLRASGTIGVAKEMAKFTISINS